MIMPMETTSGGKCAALASTSSSTLCLSDAGKLNFICQVSTHLLSHMLCKNAFDSKTPNYRCAEGNYYKVASKECEQWYVEYFRRMWLSLPDSNQITQPTWEICFRCGNPIQLHEMVRTSCLCRMKFQSVALVYDALFTLTLLSCPLLFPTQCARHSCCRLWTK